MHWLDPDYLPIIKGKVKQFLQNPHGDADGFILEDGTEVHFPPHMSAEMQDAVAIGDEVSVRGAKPRNADLIAAVAVDTSNGRRIDDQGPPDDDEDYHHGEKHKKPKHHEMEYEGSVVRALHGPKGEVRGALFEDGVTVRFKKHEAQGLSPHLISGARLAVRGKSLKTGLGTVIDAKEAGATLAEVKPLNKHKHDKEGDKKRSGPSTA